MGVPELIASKVSALPADAQDEVLEFVEFLAVRRRRREWTDGEFMEMAIGQALRDEGDEVVEYGAEDCIEIWR